ncbi:unnamed protein product [Auanema sp. JU1783]|nr:unnamed protein product [Auanema sp. JU1783]
MEKPFPPSYNLTLNTNEDPEPSSSQTIKVEENSQLAITCTRDENFKSSEFSLKKNKQVIGMTDTKGRKITYHIHEYSTLHDGMYICESQRNDGTYHSRQLRLSSKSKMPRNTKYCEDESSDLCGINGVCALHNGIPTCYCHKDYEGEHCGRAVVSDLNNTSYSTIDRDQRLGLSLNNVCMIGVIVLLIIIFAQWLQIKKLKKEKKSPSKLMDVKIGSNDQVPNINGKTLFYNTESDMSSRTIDPNAPGRDIRRNDSIRRNVFDKKKGKPFETTEQEESLVKLNGVPPND